MCIRDRCGALPVMIPGSEVLNALQTGTVDGLDNAVFNYTNQGITDVITHITEPVSYTHLDVYKRQQLEELSINVTRKEAPEENA